MHITDHLQPCCVALRQQADSLPAAIHQLVELVQKSGCLTDTVQFEQDVLEREKMGGICMGRGLAIPHAKSAGVAHAELAAITDACRSHGDWRLKGARLYVTLEPCPMCAGGILSARIPELYYGAKDAGFGACGSILNLFEEDFRHHPKIVGHILEEECAQLLQDFFAQVRKKSPENLKIL